MTKLFHSRLIVLLMFLASMGWMAEPAFAQTCSVSSTASAAGTASTACFVKAGQTVIAQLTGTWAATVQWQMSVDGGATYRIVSSHTANTSFISAVQNRPVLFRWLPYAYTSGTIAYTMNDLTTQNGRIKYSNVPIGSVAYASFGTSTAGASTVTMSTDIWVPAEMNMTGIGILVGATGGTDKFVLVIRDSKGMLLGSTDTAGTTVSASASAFQEIALTVPLTIPRGRYYIDVQTNGTTATTRRIATATFLDVTAAETTGTTFGTVPRFLAEPTTFTALKAPIVYIY